MIKIPSFLFVALFMVAAAFAQKKETHKNWYQLDKDSSGYYGISLSKAYAFLNAKKIKSKKVLVAVIDSGIDTAHEDLKPILWTNNKEIPGNGIDDDKNGYTDDVHGWNFVGGKDGRNIKENSLEEARLYHKLKAKYGTSIPAESLVKPEDKAEVEIYKKVQQKIFDNVDFNEIIIYKRIMPAYLKGDSVIRKELGKEEYDCNDLEKYYPDNKLAGMSKGFLLELCGLNKSNEVSNQQIIEQIQREIQKAEAADNPPKNYRKEIIKDDETNINDRYYGNNDIMAATSLHGTHCSGIIGAVRNNGKGVDGIADNVNIMMIRAVPDGDEYDKDVANAIRYAVDNGAQIVSMSFGKDFSPQKQWVDDAVKYAEKKDVLLVHAAGNDSKNIDSTDNFPSATYSDGKTKANNWIEVGASGDPSNGGITAYFSNYGKKNVDVFAPGVQIYSSLPGGNKYGNESGTSMACPVVAGTAALLLEYFPSLSARQLKYVIEKSAQAPDIDVTIPGTANKVKLNELCKAGGLLNAYQAVKLASTLTGERRVVTEVLPIPKMAKSKKG